ncbi:MAG TPA: dihydropteroate synthase [Lacisediminihabitans sp.]|jgi:dihydropteroate synthase|nr:dihydropteroate synthase [Lacisediminihabitans sp.]HXD60556.1 dihydropteroate synthase [Lacisediminihabitans sp.]
MSVDGSNQPQLTPGRSRTPAVLRRRAPASATAPVIMGVINMTPDSFSDGGEYNRLDAAVARAVELTEAGARLIDVGGESTRPGAQRIPLDEERRRVIPVIEELVRRDIVVSVDTMNASTALAAAEAGARLINDVSGGLADPAMARVAAETGLHFVAMHWRGPSDTMQSNAVYNNVVRDVRSELKQRVAELIVAGVDPNRIILDPGIGFAKNAEQNWLMLGHLRELGILGYPLLLGVSRKRFLGALLPEGAPVKDRDAATAVISALAAEAGVWGVRVHDVAGTRAALDVWSAMHGNGAGL